MTADEPVEGRREIEAASTLLRENGFVVYKPPVCERTGGHGRHGLKTYTEMCPGAEPYPHGLQSIHKGPFDSWAHCACGSAFRDDNDDPEGWKAHADANGVEW